MKQTFTQLFGACCALIMLFLISATSVNGQYCAGTSTSFGSEHITNVTFSGIENTTGGTGYSDFTAMTAYVVPGVSYPIITKVNNGNGSYTEYVAVWIDWNQNNVFDEDERYYLGSCSGGACLSTGIVSQIEVPASALPGTTRMRVKMDYSSAPTSACGTFTWGEVEDYSVQVETGECTPPNFTYVITNNCEAETYSVAAILNDFGTNSFISVAMTRSDGVQVYPVTISALTPIGTTYQIINNVPTGVTVTAAIQGANPICNSNRTWLSMGCYCIPTMNNGCTYEFISNVSLSGENVDLNNTSGCSENSYAYYTNLAQPDLAPGETYTLSASTTYGSPTYEQAKGWIDYNKNGEFEPNELIANTNGAGLPGGTGNFNFTVPEDVAPGSYRMRVRMVYGSGAPTWDACATGGNGETEDYKVTILELPDCQGTPSAGVIEADDDMYCANTPIPLTSIGASDPANGQIRVWQTSPTGEDNWTDIAGAASTSYSFTAGIDEVTDIRYKVTCTLSGESDISNTITLGINPAEECYCIPVGTNATYFINDFTTTGGIENITNTGSGFSTGGYGDFTAMTVKQVKTESINFIGVPNSNSNYGLRIWVDWNQDGQFDTDTEVAFASTGYAYSHTGSIVVPENAATGITRMRVSTHYLNGTGLVDPCATDHTYGEFEDYTFEIVPLEECAGTPNAGDIQVETLSVCAFTPISMEVFNASDAADGLTRIWQSSPSGQNQWADIEGANSTFYTLIAGVGEPTDFRFRATCDFSNETSYSNAIVVNLLPGVECYCTPEYTYGCSSGDQISNVSLEGESISLNNSTTCSADAYGDYTTSQPNPDLAPGETYSISISTSYSGPTYEDVYAWIDYNENGSFESSEQIASTNENGLPSSGTQVFDFTLPDALAPGDYRLRVRLIYSSSNGDPCSSEAFGETEDYKVTIIDLNACEGTPIAGAPNETAFTVCATIPFNVTVTGSSDAASGLARIWQSSPAGQNEWTNIEGASSQNFQVIGGINEPTDYRYSLTCEFSDETAISEVIEVGIKPGNECYCTPIYITGCTVGDLISNVNLEGESVLLNNTSACSAGNYADYSTSQPNPDLAPGETYSISVSTTYSFPASEDVIAWIDYNANGFFEVNEQIAHTNGNGLPEGGTGSFEFTVPDGLDPGDYKLRVRMVYSADDFDACESAYYGETEDYVVTIIDMDACSGTPSAGTPDNTAFNVCPSAPFLISVSDASDAANGLIRIWQSSPAGEDEWTDITGASARNFTVEAGIQVPTDFRYTMMCSFSQGMDVSDIIQVGIKPAQECYCTPTNNSYATYFINNVSTTGGLQNLNRQSGFSPGGYGDYTATDTLIVNQLQSLSFSIGFQDYSHNIQVWVDINQNGVFEADENVISAGSSYVSSPFTGSFIVPSDLPFGSYRIRVRTTYLYAPVPPCGDDAYSEAEDYILKVIESVECAGTPEGGTVTNAEVQVCATNNFSLTVSGATNPIDGIVRVWQSSPAGQDIWTDIAGATSTSYTAQGGITAATDYRYKVTCTNSNETDYSNLVAVTLKAATECYCDPIYTQGCTSGDLISNVTLTGESVTLNNTSTCSPGAYADNTDMAAPDLAPGNTYSISVSTTYSSPSSEQVKVWIDYNKNGAFESEELVASTNGVGLPTGGTGTYSFIVPGSLEAGNYTLRVRMGYGSGAATWDACNSTGYGETEDYLVQIIELDACSGTPSAGIAEAAEESVCGSVAFTLTATGSSDPANGLVKVWQSSPAGQNNWTDITGIAASSPNYIVSGGIAEPTDFRYRVTCTNSNETDYSNVISLTLNPANECYCIPVGTNATYFINDFTTTGGIENITNTGTGFSTGGYGDFTAMSVKQVKTESRR